MLYLSLNSCGKDNYFDCSASLAQKEHSYPAMPSSYISVVPQNKFAFQGIFLIATQFLKVIK